MKKLKLVPEEHHNCKGCFFNTNNEKYPECHESRQVIDNKKVKCTDGDLIYKAL